MAQMATQTRFEQGGWYTGYRRFEFFAQRAAWLSGLSAAPNKIGVAGCGWGYLVDELRVLGRDAYGFDLAPYCATKFAGIRPSEPGRVVTADVLNATQMTNFRKTTCGLSGTTKIPLLVTEDFLSALTDTEVTTALTQCRANATRVVHIITCARADPANASTILAGDLNNRNTTDFVWRTHQGWKSRIGNNETVMDAEGGAIL